MEKINSKNKKNKNEINNLNSDNLLNNKDINIISNINKIKKDITSYFDMNLFIEKFRNIIDNSKYFEFRSNNSRKFIEPDKPRFIIRFKNDKDFYKKIKEINGKDNIDTVNKRVNFITNIVRTDIINKFSSEVTLCIKDKNKVHNLFKDLPDGLENIIIGNIFTILVDIKHNNIQILYFI